MHSVRVSNTPSLSFSSFPACVCARHFQLMMPDRCCCTGRNSQRSGICSGSLGAMLSPARGAKALNYARRRGVISTAAQIGLEALHEYLTGSALIPDDVFLRAVEVIVERLPERPNPSA